MDIETYIIDADELVEILKDGVDDSRGASGKYCFIVGAGASRTSGIPSGQELGYRWIKWLDDNKKLRQAKNTAATLKKSGKLYHTYDEIMAAYKSSGDKREMPSEFYFDAYKLRFHRSKSEGNAELERAMANVIPGFSFNIFAQLLSRFGSRCNLVITTNFDSLVEDALFIYTDKKPLVVSHEALADYAENPFTLRPIVAKIHRGLFFDPLNDPKEMDALKGKWRDILSRLFRYYTPIVIGYGGGDHSLMDLLADEELEFKQGLYWCSYYDSEISNEKICRIIEQKDLRFVRYEGFDSLMLKFGNALFGKDILPNAVRQYLENQNNAWITKYTEGFNRASEAENKDAEALKTTEIVDTEKRDKDKKLTKWDYKQRGDEKNEAGDYIGAMAEYRKALEIDPDFVYGHNGLGWSYYGIKKYDMAIANCNKAIELDPNYAYAYNNRGIAYADLKQYDRAIADYDKAIELDPNYAYTYYNRGDAYYYLKQYDRAIADYNKAIELDPNDADNYYNRGSAYYDLKQYDRAIADFTKAIELDPNYAAAYYNRGNAYYYLKQYDRAIADYDKAIELDPNYAAAYYNRGNAYKNLKQYDRAIADYDKAIELNPNYANFYNNRSCTYDALKQYDKAIADCNKSIELDPNNAAYAYDSRGTVFKHLEQYDKAIADYNKAIELDPNYATAYNNRADAYDAIGETELAAADRAKAQELEAHQ